MGSLGYLRTLVGSNAGVSRVARKINHAICASLYALSPELLIQYRYYLTKGRLPNLSSPKTFDEKLIWLMLYCQDPLKSQCADKYGLRRYVEERGRPEILPKIIGCYDDVEGLEFADLPDRFVLKCTHGYNTNLICRDKSQFDIAEARRRLLIWMKQSTHRITGEIHYAHIRPRIICEEYLDDQVNEVPVDYKIYCFGGKAHCTMVCTGRGFGNDPGIDFYDRDWKKLHYFRESRIVDRAREILKPKAYDQMVEHAEYLSEPFHFVRMDFYDIQGKAVIGEMTFTPHGCVDPDYTDEAQVALGGMIDLGLDIAAKRYIGRPIPVP